MSRIYKVEVIVTLEISLNISVRGGGQKPLIYLHILELSIALVAASA